LGGIFVVEAKLGDRVRVHYIGTLNNGSRFDATTLNDPLEFTIGTDEVIEGFEKAVIGMRPGESKEVIISVEEGYGPRDESKVAKVMRTEFPDDMELEQGLLLQIDHPDGDTELITILNVSDTEVILDANHPLAGKPLNYEIDLLEVL
jgi:FKBP-type peptidyl-prolyl cis-trans isomerase 2